MMALVGESISRIPGPPRGPSLRMTSTSPARTRPSRIACVARFLTLEDARATLKALTFSCP